MGSLNKFKKLTKDFTEKAKNYSTEELIADSIIKAAKKQEKINKILAEKGSPYRINHLDLDIDFPPNIRFGVGLITTEDQADDSALTPPTAASQASDSPEK